METRAGAALAHYGLKNPILTPLTGGSINTVWRVDSADGAFALKLYSGNFLTPDALHRVCRAQMLADAGGVPVPRMVMAGGVPFVEVAGSLFVLSKYVPGRLYLPDTMPLQAARRMGEMLARLQSALAELPPGRPSALWPLDAIEGYLNALLVIATKRRGRSEVDERAYQLLRSRLVLLETLGEMPAFEPGWSHGDYEWRNVMFDESDEVCAVIDFDDLQYFSPAREVMRCMALSFPSLGENAFAFLAGYASASGISPKTARSYVEFYRYISAYRVWPVSARYLDPERYQTRWDEFIQSGRTWDWDVLADRFAAIAQV